MSRGIKDDEIEMYLRSLQDCEPTFDAYVSEDDCENNEDEYASTSDLLAVFDNSTEQANLSSNALAEVASTSSSNYGGNISVQAVAEQSPRTIQLEEQIATDSDYATDPSDDDEEEWTKSEWPIQPDITNFNARPLRAAGLFPPRSFSQKRYLHL